MEKKRWQYAQQYERTYWEKAANRIASGVSGQLDWYAWRANELEKRLAPYLGNVNKKSVKVLEIGSGPLGIATFLKWGECYTIDPLEDFYKSNPVLSKHRNPAVNYGQGAGEKLSFENDFFSLVILDNVLDHVHDAAGVLKEIYRVIPKDGLLYLAVNVHTGGGAFLHSILSRLRIDKGHPYTFTVEGIRRFVKKYGFNINSELINDYYQAREQDRKSSSFKNKVKGHIGLSEFIYYAVCSKKI